MMITMKNQAASHPIAVSCLVGAFVMGLTQMAGAFAPAGTQTNSSGATCEFSLQLQKSVAVQRQYLLKVDAAIGQPATASNAVEDMYGNIQPASYTAPDPRSGTGVLSIIFKSTPKKASVGIDSLSADCMSCHDGAGASSITVDLRNNPGKRNSEVDSFTSDHPIGMSYSSYVAAGHGYKSVGSNTKMIFVNGAVGCLTCHDPLNQEKGHLVMSDQNSALCLTCHNK